MPPGYLCEGYRLDLDRGTQEWRVFYFNTEKEMNEFIDENDVKNKFSSISKSDGIIPDLSRAPRFEVILRLKDGSHLQDEFYTEMDLNEFLELYKNDSLSPIENHVLDRRKQNAVSKLGCSTYMVLIVIISFVLVVTACGSPYESAMRKGKDAIHDENYEKAITQFEIALIEEPRDEDAKILLSTAKQKDQEIKKIRDQLKAKEVITQYMDDMKTHISDFKNIQEERKKGGGLFKKLDIKDQLLGIDKSLNKIISKYQDYNGIVTAHNYFSDAIDLMLKEVENEPKEQKIEFTLIDFYFRLFNDYVSEIQEDP